MFRRVQVSSFEYIGIAVFTGLGFVVLSHGTRSDGVFC